MTEKIILWIVLLAISNGEDILNERTFSEPAQICSLPLERGFGSCLKWSECSTAQLDFYVRNIPPIYCSYSKTDPVVCCDIVSSKGTLDSLDNIQARRISEQVCNELYPPIIPSNRTFPFYAAVAGDPTVPGEFKHMAALAWKGLNGESIYLCGGTLISKNFVLTAAHCASLNGNPPYSVRIGGSPLNTTSFEANIPIAKIVVHPQYTKKQVYHDIALVQLNRTSFFQPACLWQRDNLEGTETVAIGYGHTTFGGKGSNELLKVRLSIFNLTECMQYYPSGFKLESGIIQSQICASDRRNIQDTCQGDSGGPLLVKVNETNQIIPYILGITSFGQGCASGPPSVYTRVSSYLDWIESIVWPTL